MGGAYHVAFTMPPGMLAEIKARQQRKAGAEARTQQQIPKQPAQQTASSRLWSLTKKGNLENETAAVRRYIQSKKGTTINGHKMYFDCSQIWSVTDARNYITKKSSDLATSNTLAYAEYRQDLNAINKLVSDMHTAYIEHEITPLLREKADTTFVSTDPTTGATTSSLGNALINRDFYALKILLGEKNTGINILNAIKGQPLLIYACKPEIQDTDAVKFLLKHEAKANIDADGSTPLSVILSDCSKIDDVTNNIVINLLNHNAKPTFNPKVNLENLMALVADVEKNPMRTTQVASVEENEPPSTKQEPSPTIETAQLLLQALLVYGEALLAELANIENHAEVVTTYLDALARLRKIDPSFNPLNTPFLYGKKDSAVRNRTPVELAAQNDHFACLTAMLDVKDETGKPLVTIETAYTALRAAQQNPESQKVLRQFIVTSYKNSLPDQQNLKRIVMNYQQHAARALQTGKETSEAILTAITQELADALKK